MHTICEIELENTRRKYIMQEGSVRSVKDNWLIDVKSHVGSLLPRKLSPHGRRSAVVTSQPRVAVHIAARRTIYTLTFATSPHRQSASRHNPAARCSAYRREMDDLHAHLRDLPVELKAIVLSHIEHLKTRQILALSSTFQEAFSLPGALPRTYDLEGVAGDDIADHLVRLLDDDRVRSLNKERALELIGVHQDRLCEYACVQRNFEVLKWAHNKLELPWATTCTEYPVLYPPGPVSDDVLVLRMLRDTWLTDWWEPPLDEWWPEGARPEDWHGVTMENGRVVKLELTPEFDLTGAVPAVIGRLSALRHLNLYCNQLTSLPAEIGQLTSLKSLILRGNRLTSLPAEIGRLTSLRHVGPSTTTS